MTMPEWWDKSRENNNRKSRAQERAVAKARGGKVQAGSGSSWRAPQDVKDDTHLIQVKFTGKKAFTLSKQDWKALRDDAMNSGREPAYVVTFEPEGTTLLIVEVG